jgi:hypothetical protein
MLMLMAGFVLAGGGEESSTFKSIELFKGKPCHVADNIL